jgi:hypothetical protein
MNRRECRTTREEIEQSELNQRLSDQSLRHVESCPACSGFYDERTRLRELVGSLEPVTAPGDFDVKLRARIAAERQSKAPGSFFARFAMSTPALAAAALVVTLAASIFWFTQHNRNQSTVASGPPAAAEKGTAAAVEPAPDPVNQTTANPEVVAQGSQEKNPLRETSSRSTNSRPVRSATDYDLSAANSIKQGMQGADGVSLSAPVKPMVVSMQDTNGAKRRISLPPVTFGSQRLVDNRVPVNPNSRSW